MKQLKVGFFGEDKEENGESVAKVARRQENGAIIKGFNGNDVLVPARPFMRPCALENAGKWKELFADLIRKHGLSNLQIVFEELSKVVEQDIKDSINSVYEPPLSKRTLRNRRKHGNTSDKPLIDTGTMINSVKGKIT